MRIRSAISIVALGLCACSSMGKIRTATIYADTPITLPTLAEKQVHIGESDSVYFQFASRPDRTPMIWFQKDSNSVRVKSYDIIAPDSTATRFGNKWGYVMRFVGVHLGESNIILRPEGNEVAGSTGFRVRVKAR
jgi:hypothetical protein